MKDTLLHAAGGLGMTISVLHAIVAERQFVRPVQGVPDTTKRSLRAIVILGDVYWFAASLALVMTPGRFDGELRTTIAYIVAAIFASGAIANLWAFRGRHYGWPLLAVACLLTLMGA